MKGKITFRWAIALAIGLTVATAVLPGINSNFTTLQNNTSGATAALWALGPLVMVGLVFAKIAGKI